MLLLEKRENIIVAILVTLLLMLPLLPFWWHQCCSGCCSSFVRLGIINSLWLMLLLVMLMLLLPLFHFLVRLACNIMAIGKCQRKIAARPVLLSSAIYNSANFIFFSSHCNGSSIHTQPQRKILKFLGIEKLLFLTCP